MTISTDSPLLTTPEVAAMLAVSEATLSRWRTARSVPAFLTLGSMIRYDAADVLAWIEGSRA